MIRIVLSILFLSWDSDNTDDSPLAGQTFVITSYQLDTDVDFNGDGMSSNDLFIKTPLIEANGLSLSFIECLWDENLFFENNKNLFPFSGGLSFEIFENTNGELIQFLFCISMLRA